MVIKIAWRNVWRNKMRSLVIVIAIALGISAGMFLMAFSWGMYEKRIETAIEEELSHVQVHHPKFKDEFLPELVIQSKEKYLAQLDTSAIVEGYSDRVLSHSYAFTARGSANVLLIGIDSTHENNTTNLKDKIIEGEYFKKTRGVPVLVGQKLAEKLNLKLRSKLFVKFTNAEGQMISPALKVVGIYKTKNAMKDKMNLYVPKEWLQTQLDITGIHEIAVLLKDESKIATLKTDLDKIDKSMAVEKWMDLDPLLKFAIDGFDQQMDIVIYIILIALAFGIVNTMLMAVVERTKELGVLMAVGMNKPKVFSMIMIETMFLSILGTPVGLFISFLLIQYFGETGITLTGVGDSMEDMGFSNIVYPAVKTYQYGRITMMVVIVTLISAIFPAVRALRLNPTESIRKI